MSEATTDAAYFRDRAKRWAEIEDKHFGMCVWQQRSQNGRAMLEGLIHKATGQVLIVEKGYGSRLPSEISSKPWPLVEWVNVYAQLDRVTNTWDGLDQALTDFK